MAKFLPVRAACAAATATSLTVVLFGPEIKRRLDLFRDGKRLSKLFASGNAISCQTAVPDLRPPATEPPRRVDAIAMAQPAADSCLQELHPYCRPSDGR